MKTYRAPALYRGLAIFGLIMTLILAILSWLVYREDGASIGLYLLIVWAAIAVIWVYCLFLWSRSITLREDDLLWRDGRGRATAVAYHTITHVKAKGNQITITTADKKFRLHAHPFALAQLRKQLENRVPTLKEQAQQRRNARFPIIINPPRRDPFITFAALFALGVFALFVIIYALTNEETQGLQAWLMVIMFGISAFACFASTYIFITDFVWRYTFTADQIIVQHLGRKRLYDPQTITNIEIISEQRTIKGTKRTFFALQIEFANALDGRQSLRIEPRKFADTFGLSQGYEQQDLAELGQKLRALYLSAPQAVRQMMAQLANLPADTLLTQFEQKRDDFNRLGTSALPEILRQAQQPQPDVLLELLATVLADQLYRPALPDFVHWLDHENAQIRFVAAMALDAESNGRFNIASLIKDGWVQHDQIKAKIPAIKAWYAKQSLK